MIGVSDIEKQFEKIICEYPKVIKCIPILLAVRGYKIPVMDANGAFTFDFSSSKHDLQKYKTFMRESGLFDLFQHHLIHNTVDYVTGVETGLDSNCKATGYWKTSSIKYNFFLLAHKYLFVFKKKE